MTCVAMDRDSARVTAVTESFGAAALAFPTVESVNVHGGRAQVCLVNPQGVRATVHLLREGARWRVAHVVP